MLINKTEINLFCCHQQAGNILIAVCVHSDTQHDNSFYLLDVYFYQPTRNGVNEAPCDHIYLALSITWSLCLNWLESFSNDLPLDFKKLKGFSHFA